MSLEPVDFLTALERARPDLLLRGTPVGLTELQRAEAARLAAERRYRELIEHLPLVMYTTAFAPVYHTTYVSPQIEDLFGYSADEWLADVELWERVVHLDDLAIVKRAEVEARERHERFELEYRIVRADGSLGWVLDRMETLYDEDGTAVGERGFLVDVTARRESEQMFRAVFDSAFEGVLLLDGDGCFVDANAAACELLGASREGLLGRSLGMFAEPGTDAIELWRSFLEAGVATGAYTLTRGDGKRREVDYSARADVLPGRHLVVLRDVTERRSLERELWRAQRLESVGRLAGGVAHDFNNMLTAIRGYAQLLSALAVPGSTEAHHAAEIDRAAGRAAALTSQLLALGRRQMLQSRLVDLNRLILGLAGILDRMTGEDVHVVYELDPGLVPARVDPGQIEQVVLSLVTNASDAMDGRGTVVVRTANAEVGDPGDRRLDVPAGRYAVVSVRDSGRGIDEAVLENLFEPFVTTKDVGLGTGLGLAASYGIAKQSGGTIVVDSEPGRGSVFSVYLPEGGTEIAETE